MLTAARILEGNRPSAADGRSGSLWSARGEDRSGRLAASAIAGEAMVVSTVPLKG